MPDTPLDPLDAPTAGICPSCGAAVGAADEFCESCGAPLRGQPAAPPPEPEPEPVDAPSARTCSCGGTFDADGWCDRCGAAAPKERDHWDEAPAPWVAGSCDRGIRHNRNEDAMALAADAAPGSFCAIVVCDGVTSAPASDLASLAAARAARDSLATARVANLPSPSARIVHWSSAIEAAAEEANEQAAAVTAAGEDPPSCTFVAAVVEAGVLVAGWVGDSRAYWLPDEGPATQLTTDHSWASDQIAIGVPREAAEAAPEAHAITRWLGADAPHPEPDLTSATVDGPGWLLVCSDGLWNYCSPAGDLRELIAGIVDEHGDDPVTVAARLVEFANTSGGMDNVTAALARLVPAQN
ncbi:MAG: serine/threonine protein phosphatase [Actinomycetia bacterium]|nr:serine/threonine protein phosphatase [Actinomycetes bacterium]